jgi:hypothetical protein
MLLNVVIADHPGTVARLVAARFTGSTTIAAHCVLVGQSRDFRLQQMHFRKSG